jgi:hypothetical protein
MKPPETKPATGPMAGLIAWINDIVRYQRATTVQETIRTQVDITSQGTFVRPKEGGDSDETESDDLTWL